MAKDTLRKKWLDKNDAPHTCEFCKLYNSLGCPYSGYDNSKGDCDEWQKIRYENSY